MCNSFQALKWTWTKSIWTTNPVFKNILVSEIHLEQWAQDQNYGGNEKETSCGYLSLSYVRKPQILGIHHCQDRLQWIHSLYLYLKETNRISQDQFSSHQLPLKGVVEGKPTSQIQKQHYSKKGQCSMSLVNSGNTNLVLHQITVFPVSMKQLQYQPGNWQLQGQLTFQEKIKTHLMLMIEISNE